jgi:XrtJ-associated TM-motif-TM protein
MNQANIRRIQWIALAAIGVLALPLAAHAQSGCTDSPENPTIVLSLVGGAGALFSTLRRRMKSRRNPQTPPGA